MLDDIKAYLYIFAKTLGHNLTECDTDLIEMAKCIERVSLECNNFEQITHSACKKCLMKYEERGTITNKKYKYCIYSGEFSKNVPKYCPKIGIKQKVFDKTVDNPAEEIRKRGR